MTEVVAPVKRGRGRPRKVRPVEEAPKSVATEDSNVVDIDAIIADAEKRSRVSKMPPNLQRIAAHTERTQQTVSDAELAARRWHRGR
jgi:hypothetical protein